MGRWLPSRLPHRMMMAAPKEARHGSAVLDAIAEHEAARAAFDGSGDSPAAVRLVLRADLEQARTAEASVRRAAVEAGWSAGKFGKAPNLSRAVQVHVAGLLADGRHAMVSCVHNPRLQDNLVKQ